MNFEALELHLEALCRNSKAFRRNSKAFWRESEGLGRQSEGFRQESASLGQKPASLSAQLVEWVPRMGPYPGAFKPTFTTVILSPPYPRRRNPRFRNRSSSFRFLEAAQE